MYSKKNTILLLTSYLIILLSIITMPVTATGSEDDGGNYIGPDACKFCHLANYEQWLETNHSRAFQILVDRGQDKNEDCLPCHTTGYNKKTKTYKFKDVTCEVCHGSGDISNNIARQVAETLFAEEGYSRREVDQMMKEMKLSKKSMDKNLSSEVCGRCHTGEHHPTYEEWTESKHAQALVDLKKNDHAQNECLDCHSSEYITADEHSKPSLDEVTTGLTCPACHDVHSVEYPKMLRMDKDLLCEHCHTMQDAVPGEAPHHAQAEMRHSTGGVDADTYIYQPNAACADCHRYTQEYNLTGQKEHGATGHDFEINYSVCLICHEGFPTAEEAEMYVKTEQELIMARYNETEVNVKLAKQIADNVTGNDASLYSHVYNESAFNLAMVAADKSKGAHNPAYIMELIEKSDFKANNIIQGKPGARSPGFGLLMGVAMVMLVSFTLRRRSKQ